MVEITLQTSPRRGQCHHGPCDYCGEWTGDRDLAPHRFAGGELAYLCCECHPGLDREWGRYEVYAPNGAYLGTYLGEGKAGAYQAMVIDAGYDPHDLPIDADGRPLVAPMDEHHFVRVPAYADRPRFSGIGPDPDCASCGGSGVQLNHGNAVACMGCYPDGEEADQ